MRIVDYDISVEVVLGIGLAWPDRNEMISAVRL
jgi:hypothetical protein